MNSVESVIAEFKNLVIKTLDFEYGLLTLTSTSTGQVYSHYWTEQQNPVAEVKAWINRFVLARESFHTERNKMPDWTKRISE